MSMESDRLRATVLESDRLRVSFGHNSEYLIVRDKRHNTTIRIVANDNELVISAAGSEVKVECSSCSSIPVFRVIRRK